MASDIVIAEVTTPASFRRAMRLEGRDVESWTRIDTNVVQVTFDDGTTKVVEWIPPRARARS